MNFCIFKLTLILLGASRRSRFIRYRRLPSHWCRWNRCAISTRTTNCIQTWIFCVECSRKTSVLCSRFDQLTCKAHGVTLLCNVRDKRRDAGKAAHVRDVAMLVHAEAHRIERTFDSISTSNSTGFVPISYFGVCELIFFLHRLHWNSDANRANDGSINREMCDVGLHSHIFMPRCYFNWFPTLDCICELNLHIHSTWND